MFVYDAISRPLASLTLIRKSDVKYAHVQLAYVSFPHILVILYPSFRMRPISQAEGAIFDTKGNISMRKLLKCYYLEQRYIIESLIQQKQLVQRI